MITADRAASEVLVRHPDVDKVAFTGSSAIGKRIASICGERVARYTLELGGKSAAVVLDDYDVGQAAQHLAMVTPVMSGQVCAALTRVIVPRNRHDQLVDALSSRSEEHTSELQSLMRISYAVFCLKKKKNILSPTNTSNKL